MNDSIPAEYLEIDTTRALRGHPPTRLAGNRQAAHSPDPYYQTFADVGPYANATAHHHALERSAEGHALMPMAYRRAATEFDPAAQSPRRLTTALRLIGALASFRALTNNQAATIAGDEALADPRSGIVSDLFASGLIDIASPYLGAGPGGLRGGTVTYQLGDLKVVRRLLQNLTTAEVLAVTGGRPLPIDAVHLRHDVLAAELALRVAMHLPCGTVLGPHFSTFADLTAGCRYPSRASGGPDLVLVREDGLRVAVEITASIGERFRAKVARWSRILVEAPLGSSGLVVVFLVAPAPASLRRHGDRVRRTTYGAVAEAVRLFPGSLRDPVAARMGVATWREWFPHPGEASERFDRMRVDRPGLSRGEWEPCDLWDPTKRPLTAASPDALRAIIKNSSLLVQTPPQIRERHQPARTSAALIRQATGDLRDVAPLREPRRSRPVGLARGAAGDPCLPPRLIGPAADSHDAASQPVLAAAPHPDPAPEEPHRAPRVVRRRPRSA